METLETPTGVVTTSILIEGNEVEAYDVKSISVNKEVNKIAAARIVMYDGSDLEDGFLNGDSDDFIPGNAIEIQVGYDSEKETIFKGIIIKQSIKRTVGRFELIIDCKHAATKMTIDENSQYFYKAKDDEIIEELIQPYGISFDVEPTKVKHQEMVQYQTSDWEFMVIRAQYNSQLVFAVNDEIRIAAPDFTQEPMISLNPDSIMEIEIEMDARHQLNSVSAYSWDPSSQKVISAEGVSPEMEEQGNIDAEILSETTEHEEYKLKHAGAVKELELQAWADSKLLRSRLAKIRGRIKYQGDVIIEIGDTAEIEGIGERYDGTVYITGIRHQITNKNWETELQFGLSPDWFEKDSTKHKHQLVPPVSGLHTGIIVQLKDDPESEDRVLVRSPMISDKEKGVWARVSCLDAGENRGSFFRPEIDDEVVLGFVNNDPRHPIILGMLNSSAKPAPIVASDENPIKGFVTKKGIKFLFDDELEQITLETPAGNTFTISDDAEEIQLEDSNKNCIKMNADGITIESASDLNLKATGDLKIEAMNIEQSADAEFKLDGGAGLELTTGAIAVLKGSLVQIN